jgi:tRNA uridine 5-carbamoylmethylation protein Kti12
VQDCFGRNAARVTNRVPDETIQRMAAKFQEPDGAKHGWEGRTIVLVDYRQSLEYVFP